MNRLWTLLALDQPQETRFFLVLGAFGLILGIVYWFLSHEAAGTALLVGFGIATGVVGVFLAAGRGTGGVDRPFLDESGRLPSETLAPFAVGVGLATAATALVFGPAMLIAGAVPLAWGVRTWLARATAELDAQERAGVSWAARPPDGDEPRTGGRAPRAAGEESRDRRRARSRSG